jgi:hypothetical protein
MDSCQAACVGSAHHLGMLVWKTYAHNVSFNVLYKCKMIFTHTQKKGKVKLSL